MAGNLIVISAVMSKSGFGDRLKRERELRGLSRDEVCTATRIGGRFLDALENERWEILPGGVFNRGFLRAVARFLGLDEEDLIAQYDQAISDQHSLMEARANPKIAVKPPRSRLWRFALLGTLCAAALFGMGWLGWRWRQESFPQTPSDGKPVSSALGAASQPEANPLGVSVASASGEATAAATPGSTRSEGHTLELKVEAGKETALTVSADGSKVFEGSMIAGQSRTFTAQDAIDISAKDAGALLLELNGQTLAPLGPPGQPGNATLTRSDVKPAGGGAD